MLGAKDEGAGISPVLSAVRIFVLTRSPTGTQAHTLGCGDTLKPNLANSGWIRF
jgi:hypothetical protein